VVSPPLGGWMHPSVAAMRISAAMAFFT
jgi:hypothetical protein